VADYRVYTLGKRDGQIVDSRIIEAETDAEAMTAAQTLVEQNDLEVWTGKRRVGQIKAEVRS
jgi:hypothetical protein